MVETEEFRRGDDGEEDTDSERIERSFRVSGECRPEEFERKSNTEGVRVARRKVERYVWSTRCARKDGENVSIRNKTRGGRYNVMVSWRVLRRINVFRISPREVERANVEADIRLHLTLHPHFTSILVQLRLNRYRFEIIFFQPKNFIIRHFINGQLSLREKKSDCSTFSRVIRESLISLLVKLAIFVGYKNLHSFHKRNIY